jgi:Holliday junction resolvasome RuvABC ATP-dependent DNA helicase subunit
MRQNADMIYVNGTALKDIISIREYFIKARENPKTSFLVFVDEAHGLKKSIQTSMLSMLESPYVLTCTAPREVGNVETPEGVTRFVDRGDILREKVPDNMSFAMASTDRFKLIEPLMGRLRHIDLAEYTTQEVVEIAKKNLAWATPIDHIMGMANRHRSIRHLIEELCTTYKEIVAAYGSDNVMNELDDVLGIDDEGATDNDINYMKFVAKNGTVGVDNIANFFHKDPREIKEDIEPFLLGKAWIRTTSRGREVTDEGKRKLGMLI